MHSMIYYYYYFHQTSSRDVKGQQDVQELIIVSRAVVVFLTVFNSMAVTLRFKWMSTGGNKPLCVQQDRLPLCALAARLFGEAWTIFSVIGHRFLFDPCV